MPAKLQPWANIGAPLALWVMLWSQLAPEWWLNEQYGYGMFVPLLGAYLLWRRWADRPEPEPMRQNALLWGSLVLLIILLYPIRIIYNANADWRALTWGQALLTLGVTLLFVANWGGKPWVKFFTPAIIFWLFANPWPMAIEKPVTSGLMSMVAGWVVESANMLGVFAERSGNIIRLSNGLVSVEEACSGVRSLQSTLMAAYFLGELLRFKWPIRIGLIIAGCALAILFNYARTLTLTIVTARSGVDIMERWHDPAGYMVFVMCVIGLLMLTAIAQKLRGPQGAIDGAPLPEDFEPRLLPAAPLAVAIVAMIGSAPVAWAWYQWRQPAEPFAGWRVNWDNIPAEVHFEPINPRIEEVLHYSEGQLAEWRGPGRLGWMAYYLQWDSARAAQLGGIHRPEACLPAGGWNLIERFDDFVWEGPKGLQLIFNTFEFSNGERDMYVFYCQWDRTNYPYHDKLSRAQIDRLRDAWAGERKAGKIKLEVFCLNARTRHEALNQLKEILAETIEPQ